MATWTPRLGLRKPAANDPFSRVSDFLANWDTIDATPGILPGPESERTTALAPGPTRPDPSGRFYYSTDIQRLQYLGAGNTWFDVLGNPQSFSGYIPDPMNTPPDGTTRDFSFPVITLKRPSVLAGVMTCQVQVIQHHLCDLAFSAKMTQGTSTTTASIVPIGLTRIAVPGGSDVQHDVFTVCIPIRTVLLAAGAVTPKITVTAGAAQDGDTWNATHVLTATV